MKKNNIKKQQIITISIFSVIIVIILAFFLLYLGRPEINDTEELEPETKESVLIPIEFLTEDELMELNADPNIRAQVLSRDPLIYKVIKDDNDIIEDISPYLKPIRQD